MNGSKERSMTLTVECSADDEFSPAPTHVSVVVTQALFDRAEKLIGVAKEHDLDHVAFREGLDWGGWINGPAGPMECQMITVDKYGYLQLEGIPKHCNFRVSSNLMRVADIREAFQAPEAAGACGNILISGKRIFYSGSAEMEVLQEAFMDEQTSSPDHDHTHSTPFPLGV